MSSKKHRDPALLAKELAVGPPRPEPLLVLGIDPGTSCGVCYAYHDPSRPLELKAKHFYMGQWDLSAGPFDSGSIRFARLRQFLAVLRPDFVCYEQVRFSPDKTMMAGSMQAIMARAATSIEFMGAIKGTLCTWCEENGVPCTGFAIGEIKKRATGKGVADKKLMIQATNSFFGVDLDPENFANNGDDNVADAVWTCVLGLEQYGAGILPAGTYPVPASESELDG